MRRNTDDDPEVKRELRRLDGVLPEDIDRRSFFKKTVASVAGSALLAGCTGSGDQETDPEPAGGSGDGGGSTASGTAAERLAPEATFRNFWRAKPGYAFEYMTAAQSFLDEELNAAPPEMEAGTNDALNYTANNEAQLGLSEWSITTNGVDQGFDSKTFGISNAKTFVGLIYREDLVDGPEDLEGMTVGHTGHLMELTWPIYNEAIGDPDIEEFTYVEENVAGAFLAENDPEVDALWTTINDIPSFRSSAPDVSLGVDSLYGRQPLYGNNLVVSNQFLEENREYVNRYLTAYSMAGKWSLLNPEEVVDLFREEIRPELQTEDRENQIEQMKISVGWTNFTDGIKDNGVGYLNEEVAKASTEAYAESLELDSAPSIDEFIAWGPQEDAELQPFTDDEWAQVQEFAEPYPSQFSSE